MGILALWPLVSLRPLHNSVHKLSCVHKSFCQMIQPDLGQGFVPSHDFGRNGECCHGRNRDTECHFDTLLLKLAVIRLQLIHISYILSNQLQLKS